MADPAVRCSQIRSVNAWMLPREVMMKYKVLHACTRDSRHWSNNVQNACRVGDILAGVDLVSDSTLPGSDCPFPRRRQELHETLRFYVINADLGADLGGGSGDAEHATAFGLKSR